MAPFYPNVIPAKHENSYVAAATYMSFDIFSRNGHRGWMDPGRKYDEQTPRAYVCDDNVVSLFFELQYVIDYIHRVLLL